MRKAIVFLLRLYKKFISPMLPPSCRFKPTCSEYAMEAFEKFGVLKGFYLSIRRVMRCNPYHRGGWDPVPDVFSFHYRPIPRTRGGSDE